MPMENLTLIGMPGAGKSTLGVVLAKALGWDFLDGDLLIQKREGKLLQQIMDERGVEEFLDLEAQVLSGLHCRRTVVAPGGSCVLRSGAMTHLRSLGPVVYLKLSYPDMEARISNLATRGIALKPGQTLKDVYDQRSPLYEAWADLTLEVGKAPIPQTLARLLEAVRAL